MVQSSQYPEERQTRRVLELSYPEVDAEVRENLAYLVSVRRMTLDDALAELEDADRSAQTNRNAATTASTTTGGPRRTTTATRNNGGASESSTAPTTATAPYSQRSVSGRRAPETSETRAPPRRTSASDGEHHDEEWGEGGYCGNGGGGQRTGGAAGGTSPSTSPATVHQRPTADSSPPNTRPLAPLTCMSPMKPTAATASGSGTGRQGRYTSSHHRADTRVSRSDSELTEMRESARSLVRSEDESRQCSAPDVLSARPSDGVSMYRNGPTSSTAATTSSRRQRGAEGEVVTVAAAGPVKSRNGVWAALSEEKPQRGSFGAEEESGQEPLFTDTKLVTEDEKAHYEEKMQDMMHYWYRDETSMYDYTLRSLPAGQVLFFTTSMTGDRRVRDHCRLMENLLYLKLIPHHTIDVADSEFFLRRVRKMYTHATRQRVMPELPLLFVDDTLIGNFTTVQELEDAGELDAKLLSAGCSVLRTRVVAECEAKLAGLPGAPLVLPTNPSQTTRVRSSRAAAASAVATTAQQHSGPTSPTAPNKRSSAVLPPATSARKSFAEEEGGESGVVRSPVKRSDALRSGPVVSARAPPSRAAAAPPSTSSPLPPTSPTSREERRATTKTSARDYATGKENANGVVDAPPPPSSACRFANGRRLDRTSVISTNEESPAPEARRTTSMASRQTEEAQGSDAVVPGVSRSIALRTSARAPLGRSGASGRPSVEEAERTSPSSSAVPRLPSLASRAAEGRDTDLPCPASHSAASRRYTAQPRASLTAASVASRVPLC